MAHAHHGNSNGNGVIVGGGDSNNAPETLDDPQAETPVEKLKNALSSKPLFQQYYLVCDFYFSFDFYNFIRSIL